MNESMWAVQYDRYGPPDVLTMREVPRPRPRRGEAVVRVLATSVNRIDLHYRRGAARVHGVGFPKGTGFDVIGVVEESPDPADVPVGSTVWGILGIEISRRRGSAAEYLALARNRYGVLRSAGTDPDPELAALPLTASTALVALRDKLRVRPGQRVLVVGGSGGVGTAALQLCAVLGATVDAVASAPSLPLCRELGASRTFDYRSTSPSEIDERYDGVLVAAGRPSSYRPVVRPGGRMVAVNGDAWIRDPRAILPGGRPRIPLISVGPNPRDLEWLGTLVAQGNLRPVVDTSYPMADAVAAHRDQEEGPTRGKRLLVHT